MKGTIDFITGGTQMTLTYRYFPDTDEFELIRGIYWAGVDIDPFTLHQLETAVPYAEQIRDLIYLDLCAWGCKHVVAECEALVRELTPVARWIKEHASDRPTANDALLGCTE